MNIAEALRKEHTKALTLRIGKYIGRDRERFAKVVNLVLDKDAVIAQRAAWVLGTHGEKYPELIVPHLQRLLPLLSKPVHPALKKNLVRVLQYLDIPSRYESSVVSKCFELIHDNNEAIAVKAFSISIISNLAKKYPDLMIELKAWLETNRSVLSKAEIKRMEQSGLISKI